MTMQLEMNLQDDAALGSQAEAIYTPAIRFKGFSGNWERYNFSDVSESFEYGLNAAATEYDGENKYIRITDINEKTRALDLNDLTSPNFDLSKAENYKLHLGDLLFARTGASVGKTYIYKKNDGVVYFAGFLIRAKLKNTVSSQFIFQSTLTEKYNKFIRLTSQRSGQPGVNAKEYGLCEIYLSQLEEQTAIGNYFQQLDSLIAQHQHKHTKLLNLKQALLQKMFPKQGASVPEVRFKGFSGDWEEQKWRESVDISREMVNPKNGLYDELFHIGPGNIESFTGRIYNNVLRVKDSNLISGKFYFKKGDIIYGKINPQLAKQIIAPFEGLASADAYILNAKNETAQSYLYVILQTGNFYKYSVSVSARTGMPKINREELDLYTYQAPKKLEQTKIGNLFQQLDHLITPYAPT